MELKPGYKQTEVGVIPEEWEVSTFAEVFNVTAGGDVDPKRSASYQDETRCYPIYSNALTGRGLYGYCSYADHQAGSITITARGTLGVANFRDHAYTAIGRVLVLQPEADVDGRFFAEFINNRISFVIESTGVPQLTAPQISKYKLPVPPLPEQRAIAGALGDVDALLGAQTQLIAKKHDLKQAAMQQLLTGKKRLPGFGKPGGRWKPTSIGVIPQDWNAGPLQSVTLKIQDGTHFSPTTGGSDFLYVTSRNIGFGCLDVSDAERIDAKQHRQIYGRCDVRKGDVLLTKDGANTGNAALNTLDEQFSLLSSVAFLRFDSMKFCPAFFLHQLLSTGGQQRIKGLMSGNAITRLTLQKIRALWIAFPSLPEQTAIAAVLSDMDAELAALEQQMAKIRALKQGMMQELLTGRIRLV